ncbi:ArsA-related P-loop ATPase [Gordonia sp. ABSL1-1]|uniref:ArsA-related P-loop ATPase n=1 Tax=Gordonia sp. ABSL1-1 TaxID=3053923 RepID=UPI002573BA1A|nr:ArsA-related P-loop ATPase [Gordonia sp. ABSL1-1]MDL9937378.1 ArsA-related P-loop ATPase [Gordonia sp. ABSL1-1]
MVLGPGGSGVSVAAAAAAAQRPRARAVQHTQMTAPDRHTLLITLDRRSPITSWAGVYRQPGEAVAVTAHLHLLTLERLDLTEQTWSAFVAVLADTLGQSRIALPGLGRVAEIDAAELTALPGIEDFLLLRRIRDEAVSGQWQRIVVDCSGIGDPSALLRSGAVLAQALNRFWPRHRRLAVAAERPALAAMVAAVDSIDRDCADIAEVFTDPHAVAVHVVLGADDRGRRLAQPILADLDLMGLPLASVLVNESAVGADPAGTVELTAHLDEVLTVRTDDPTVAITVIRRSPEPIDRVARLRKLGVSFAPPHGRAQGSSSATVAVLGGSGLDTTFELSWPQLLPEPDRLRLGRSADDLLVTVSGFRHPVRLPSVLRRCQVVDAAWDGVRLRIRFVPDPAVWPQSGTGRG